MRKTHRFRTAPLWKQAIAFICLAYWIAAWVVPTFMLPFFNVLPYLQRYDFYERLCVSVIGSVSTFVALYALDRKKFVNNLKPYLFNRWGAAKHYLGILFGLTLFTYMAAECSANSLGILVKVFPGDRYKALARIEGIEYAGSKYKSVTLILKDESDSKPKYLTLSKRLFDYPKFSYGDQLLIKGKTGAFGTYIEEVEDVSQGAQS